MEVLKRFSVVLLVALTAGCEFTRDPVGLDFSEQPVGVYSVLRAGSDTVSVLLVRYKEDVQAFEAGFEPIGGAEVQITAGSDTLRLDSNLPGFSGCFVPAMPGAPETVADSGCYAAVLPGGVHPSERYELRVRLPSGETIRGVTQVPRPPEFLAPDPNARLQPNADGTGFTLRLRFDAPPEAGLVALNIQPVPEICQVFYEREDIDPRSPLPVGGPGRDSATVRLLGVGCSDRGQPVALDSIPARLLLTAYDTAYARYVAQVVDRNSVLQGRASAGVEGALGVFAGAASAERRAVFVPAR